jgi:hypothetical protein
MYPSLYRTVLLALFCTFSFVLSAQIHVRLTDVNLTYTSIKYKLPSPASFNKQATYIDVHPDRYYHLPGSTTFSFRAMGYWAGLRKTARLGEAEYTFKCVTGGISDFYEDGMKVSPITNLVGVVKQSPCVKMVSFKCPYRVDVFDKDQKLIKRFIISDSNRIFTRIIDNNFLLPEPSPSGPKIEQLNFPSADSAQSYFRWNQVKILEKIEKDCLQALIDETTSTLKDYYDEFYKGKMFIWTYLIDAKYTAEFPAISTKAIELKKLFDDFEDSTKRPELLMKFQEQYDFYMAQLQGSRPLPVGVAQLCRLHASISALFLGKIPEAERLYKKFYSKHYIDGGGNYPLSYKNLFNFFNRYHTFYAEQSKMEINVSKPIDDIHYARYVKDEKFKDRRIQKIWDIEDPIDMGYNKARNERLIHLIWLCFNSFDVASSSYYEPGDYLYKSGTQEIIGRKYYYGDGSKSSVYIQLDSTLGNIVSAKTNFLGKEDKVYFEYDRNLILGLQGDRSTLKNFDFKFIHAQDDSTIVRIKLNGGPFMGNAVEFSFDWEGEKLKKVNKLDIQTSVEANKIKAYKEFSYSDTGVMVYSKQYQPNKTDMEKYAKVFNVVYRRLDGNRISMIVPNESQTTVQYDDKNQRIKSYYVDKDKKVEEDYFYQASREYKRVALSTDLATGTVEKTIVILEEPFSATDESPVYDRKKGTYRFNSAGELIYESDGNRYRVLKNGNWSKWSYLN